jgi:hypothetical protein
VTNKIEVMNTIYLLKLDEIEEMRDTPNDDFTHPIFSDLALTLGDVSEYIGFSDDECVFVRLPESKLTVLEYILNKYTSFTKEDITDRVISGEIQKLYPEVEELSPMIFEKFRIDVTTVDHVLDKISVKGLWSLDSIDMNILKREKTTH